jgi:hypothetical protein
MSHAKFSLSRCLGAVSALVLLAACGSGQPTPKPAGSNDSTTSTQSTAKTDSTVAAGHTTTTPPKETEVTTNKPGKAGSDLTDTGGDKPYQLTRYEIERPPFAYTLKSAIPVDASPAPTFVKVSEKKNKITDDLEWFEKNGLKLAGRMPMKSPTYPKPPEPGSETMGSDKLHYLLDHGDHTILMYGANFAATTMLVLLDKAKIVRGQFDFSTFVKPPEVAAGSDPFTHMEVLWAQQAGDILYVSTAHHTDAKSSKGKNAFITAFDMNTGTLRWQSEPLVCNSTNFIMQGAYIICGYGFSKESDFIYVISRADGKTVSKTPLKSGPAYLVMKDKQLFVRTYDTDYVFDVK